MIALLERVFRTDIPYWRSVTTLGFVAVVPSLILVQILAIGLTLAGVDVDALIPKLQFNDPWFPFLVIVLAPILETVLLAIGLAVLAKLIVSPFWLSASSAVLWGLMHGIQAPLWFVGTFWSFFVFSRGYLAWRTHGPAHAFGAALIPHMIQNAFAVALSNLLGAS